MFYGRLWYCMGSNAYKSAAQKGSTVLVSTSTERLCALAVIYLKIVYTIQLNK